MLQERLSKQALLVEVKGKGWWDNLAHFRMTTLGILDGIGWGFNQAKYWNWWRTVMCGGSILSCCPYNLLTLTNMRGLWKNKIYFNAQYCSEFFRLALCIRRSAFILVYYKFNNFQRWEDRFIISFRKGSRSGEIEIRKFKFVFFIFQWWRLDVMTY